MAQIDQGRMVSQGSKGMSNDDANVSLPTALRPDKIEIDIKKNTDILNTLGVNGISRSVATDIKNGNFTKAVATMMETWQQDDMSDTNYEAVLLNLRKNPALALSANQIENFEKNYLNPALDLLRSAPGTSSVAERFDFKVSVRGSLKDFQDLGLRFEKYIDGSGDIKVVAPGAAEMLLNGNPTSTVRLHAPSGEFNDTKAIEIIGADGVFKILSRNADGTTDVITMTSPSVGKITTPQDSNQTSMLPPAVSQYGLGAGVIIEQGKVDAPVVMTALVNELRKKAGEPVGEVDPYVAHCANQRWNPIIKPDVAAGLGQAGRDEVNRILKPYDIELKSPVYPSTLSVGAAITIDSTYAYRGSDGRYREMEGNPESVQLQNGKTVAGIGLEYGVEKLRYNNQDIFRTQIKDSATGAVVDFYVQPTNANLDAKDQSVFWANAIKDGRIVQADTSLKFPEAHIEESGGRIPELHGRKFGKYTINETIQMKLVDITTGGVTAKAAMGASGSKSAELPKYDNEINGSYSYCIADKNGIYFTGIMGTENLGEK